MKNQTIYLIAASLLATASCLAATNNTGNVPPANREDQHVARLLNIVNSQGSRTVDNIKSVLVHISPGGRASKVEVAPLAAKSDMRQFTAQLRQAQLGPLDASSKEKRIKLTFTTAPAKN
ncbi:MAG TPA: hypothetical protein V6D22_25285 [Candidatus Obscuribacterales bacterium]